MAKKIKELESKYDTLENMVFDQRRRLVTCVNAGRTNATNGCISLSQGECNSHYQLAVVPAGAVPHSGIACQYQGQGGVNPQCMASGAECSI